MSAMPSRHVVTADQYERMVDSGAFDDERVELMLGEILDMSPIGSAHQACVNRLNRAFAPLFVAGHAIVQVQGSVRISDFSEPQPDVALLKPREDFYAHGHPCPDDVLLAIEVADTSARYDRTVKLPAYALAGLVEAWVVDLNTRTIEVATLPTPKGFDRVEHKVSGDSITPSAIAGVYVAVDDVLGRA